MSNISLDDLKAGKSMLFTTTAVDELEVLEETQQTLSVEQRSKVDAIKKDINLLDSQQMVTYGVGAQRQITDFADNILNKVRAKDAGHVGEVMTDLMVTVKSLEIDNLNGDGGFLSKLPFGNTLKRFMAKYQTIDMQIEKIEDELDKSRMSLLKDIGMFDQLYQKNLSYFKDLELLIVAGDEKVKEARTEVLPKLAAEAKATGDQMDAQLVSDFENTIDRFEKKVHDLKLSKTIAIQTAPQIRLIQNNDKLLVDKIQTAILNTIPLWKNQIVIALGLQNQANVLKMQQKIGETTNDLLKKNAELLKQNTIETARESEKGIVEIETLKKVNTDLIETIDETMKIHREGRAARQAAEVELVQIENQLKETLIRNTEVR